MSRNRPVPRSEAKIVQDILDHVNDMERGHARKVHGSRYQSAGEPDVDACVDGRAFKVEVKVPGERPTPLQYAALRRWEAAGALAGWAVSVEDVDRLLEHLGDTRWRNPQICKHRHCTPDERLEYERCADCGWEFPMAHDVPERRL